MSGGRSIVVMDEDGNPGIVEGDETASTKTDDLEGDADRVKPAVTEKSLVGSYRHSYQMWFTMCPIRAFKCWVICGWAKTLGMTSLSE